MLFKKNQYCGPNSVGLWGMYLRVRVRTSICCFKYSLVESPCKEFVVSFCSLYKANIFTADELINFASCFFLLPYTQMLKLPHSLHKIFIFLMLCLMLSTYLPVGTLCLFLALFWKKRIGGRRNVYLFLVALKLKFSCCKLSNTCSSLLLCSIPVAWQW